LITKLHDGLSYFIKYETGHHNDITDILFESKLNALLDKHRQFIAGGVRWQISDYDGTFVLRDSEVI
jgi:hypothetical protein